MQLYRALRNEDNFDFKLTLLILVFPYPHSRNDQTQDLYFAVQLCLTLFIG